MPSRPRCCSNSYCPTFFFKQLQRTPLFCGSTERKIPNFFKFNDVEFTEWIRRRPLRPISKYGAKQLKSRRRNLRVTSLWIGTVVCYTDAVFAFQPWRVVFFSEEDHPYASFLSRWIALDPEFYRYIMSGYSWAFNINPYFFFFKKYAKKTKKTKKTPWAIFMASWRGFSELFSAFVTKKLSHAVNPEYSFFDHAAHYNLQKITPMWAHERVHGFVVLSLPFSEIFRHKIEAFTYPTTTFLVHGFQIFKKPVTPVAITQLSNAKLSLFFRLPALFYFFAKKTLVPLLIAALFIVFSFILFKLAFLRVGSAWLAIFFFVFWLLSGFNYFLKHYRYGKYTSANQRFWRRALMCFWLIEGFLFVLFFYYALNASAEPLFMYDQVGFYSRQLQLMDSFLVNCFLVVSAINLLIYLLIILQVNTYRQYSVFLIIITLILVYVLQVESYQFYYLTNYYDESQWVFSEDDLVWELEYEIPRARNKNHYMTLIILAKFWHYIFIFGSWVFFVMKTIELGRARYALLSMNLQNLIIFYIMNWVCLYSWLKWLLRRFMDQQYYWFFSAYRPTTINSIFVDVYNLSISSVYCLLARLFTFTLSDNLTIDNSLISAFDVFSVGSRVGSSLFAVG